TLLIPNDHQAVVVQHWRTALTELVAHQLVAEIFLPEQLAVHVVDVHALRLEPREYALAVGDRRARCPCAVVLMARFVRRVLSRDPFPDGLAGTPIDREHQITM